MLPYPGQCCADSLREDKDVEYEGDEAGDSDDKKVEKVHEGQFIEEKSVLGFHAEYRQ